MSNHVSDLVVGSTLVDAEFAVAHALANWASDDGVTWPPVEDIVWASRCSERTVRYALRGLEKRGFLERREVRGRGVLYRLDVEALKLVQRPRPSAARRARRPGEMVPDWARDGGRDAGGEGGNGCPPARRTREPSTGGAVVAGVGGQPAAPGGAMVAPNTSETHHTSEADASETGARAQAPTVSDFERFWGAYPNRTGRGRARRFWGGLVKAGTLPAMDVLLAAVQRYAAGKPVDRQWLTPATWLADEHWLDDPPPDAASRRLSPSSASSVMPPVTVPEDLHAAVAEGCGAAWAASYLSGAVVEDGRLRPRSGLAWEKLGGSEVVGAELARRGLVLVKPEPAAVR